MDLILHLSCLRWQGNYAVSPLHISHCGPSRRLDRILRSMVASGLKEHVLSGQSESSHLCATWLTLLDQLSLATNPTRRGEEAGWSKAVANCPHTDISVIKKKKNTCCGRRARQISQVGEPEGSRPREQGMWAPGVRARDPGHLKGKMIIPNGLICMDVRTQGSWHFQTLKRSPNSR